MRATRAFNRNASDEAMGIAELAQHAGVTPRTIRYYVAEGLLPAPGGRGQRRAYTQEHLDRLDQIRQLKAAYLPLHEIRRRLAAPVGSPPSRTGDDVGEADSRAAQRLGAGDLSGTVDGLAAGDLQLVGNSLGAGGSAVTALFATPVASSEAPNRPPLGFGSAPGVGRIEIYEPAETVWRRHILAPGIEIHYRETDDTRLAEAIQRLIREAPALLDARAS